MWKIKGDRVSFGALDLGPVANYSLSKQGASMVLNLSITVENDIVFVSGEEATIDNKAFEVAQEDKDFALKTLQKSYAQEIEDKTKC